MEWVITRTPRSLKHGGWKTTFLLGFGNFSGAIFHHPIIGGEDFHFDSYFSDGWFNHQPVFKYEFFQVSSPDVLKKNKINCVFYGKTLPHKTPGTWNMDTKLSNKQSSRRVSKNTSFCDPFGGWNEKNMHESDGRFVFDTKWGFALAEGGGRGRNGRNGPWKADRIYTLTYIYIYIPTRKKTWLAGKSTMNELMYFLLNMGILQPVMLVFRCVYMEWKWGLGPL